MVSEREKESVTELVKKIQEKQDESEARYKQLLSERQQRAAELAHGLEPTRKDSNRTEIPRDQDSVGFLKLNFINSTNIQF